MNKLLKKPNVLFFILPFYKNDRVKKIILENQHKSMQEIHDIMDEEFIKWMGSSKQLDNVLMVGIRV